MNQRLAILFRLSFIILDLLVLNLSFLVSWLIFKDRIAQEAYLEYTYLFFFSNAAWVVIGWLAGIYRQECLLSFEKFCRHSIPSFIYFVALEMLYLFLYKDTVVSRLFLASILTFFMGLLLMNRFVHLALWYFFRNKNFIVKKVLILGYNERSKKLAEYLEQQPIKNEIVGFCEEEDNVTELSHYPIIGNVSSAIEASRQYHVTEIFSTIAPEQQRDIYRLMKQADQACIRFRIIPDLSFFVRRPVHIDYLNDMPVLSLRKEPLDDIGNRIHKRIFDIVVSSLVILFILSWLIPILSLLIWLDSRGPVFFIQQRSGLNGRPFNCIKFRSMRLNRDANQKQATKDDVRITRLGRFLRKTNLDEMPQFLNVWKSDMSITGPRPHMVKHTDSYSRVVSQYMIRHFLKPGITGWAQIHGFRGEVRVQEDINKRVEYDLWYLENWSLWLDARIIVLTVFNMLKGEKNAY
jgi:putative colanic acid biosysnthesis UDP-glucose lipid carrier transferase